MQKRRKENESKARASKAAQFSNRTQLSICYALRDNSSFVFCTTISLSLDDHFSFCIFAFLFSVLSVRKEDQANMLNKGNISLSVYTVSTSAEESRRRVLETNIFLLCLF